MEITAKIIKENEDGSAVCELNCDRDAVQFLIGEGFIAVIRRALESSESYLEENIVLEGFFEQDIDEEDFDDEEDDDEEEDRLLGDMTISELRELLKENK
jgi:hypothetical protein